MSRGFINILGPVWAHPFKRGAGEVLAARKVTVSDSTTRVTVATPTSGKKIRIISIELNNTSSTPSFLEVYFGVGASIGAATGKEISDVVLVNSNHYRAVWPDGGGPVGAVDNVLSLRTAINIATSGFLIAHYREE